jgi:hypothetical protein
MMLVNSTKCIMQPVHLVNNGNLAKIEIAFESSFGTMKRTTNPQQNLNRLSTNWLAGHVVKFCYYALQLLSSWVHKIGRQEHFECGCQSFPYT